MTLKAAHQIRYEVVRAQAWQKEFWTKQKMPKGVKFDTKAQAALEFAKLWPGDKIEGSKKYREGVHDAALVAEYGRRKGI